MRNHPLISLWAELDDEESEAFRTHLKHDPKVKPQAVTLFKYIEKNARKDLDFQQAYHYVYGKRADYRKTKVSNLLSAIKVSLMKFLIHRKLHQNSDLRDYLEALVLLEKNQKTAFPEKAMKYLEGLITADVPPARIPYAVDLTDKILAYEYSLDKGDKYTVVQAIQEHIDRYFVVHKLKTLLYLRQAEEHAQQEVSTPLQVSFIQTILEVVPKYFQDDFLIQAYYLAFLVESTGSEESFKKLSKLLQEQEYPGANDAESDTILTILLNRTTKKITELGDRRYYEQAFELHKIGIHREYVIANEVIAPQRFLNICNIACHLGEFEWVETFIKKYQEYLLPSSAAVTVRLARAAIFINRGAPRPAILELRNLGPMDDQLQLTAKLMLMRALYMEEQNPVAAHNEDFPDPLIFARDFRRQWRDEKERPASVWEAADNYAWVIVELCKQQKAKDEILEKVAKMKHLFSRRWLLNELASYKKIN